MPVHPHRTKFAEPAGLRRRAPIGGDPSHVSAGVPMIPTQWLQHFVMPALALLGATRYKTLDARVLLEIAK